MPSRRCAVEAMKTHSSPSDTAAFGLWSHDFSLVTGQAFVTARAAALMRRRQVCEFVYRGPGLTMLWTWLRCTARLWSAVLRNRVNTLYLVCSRSNTGFLRDLPAYLVIFVGVRVLVHAHGSDIVDLMHRPVWGALARRLFRRCELIVPSAHLLQPLTACGVARLHLCENFATDVQPGSADGGWSALPGLDNPGLSVLWNSNILASKGFFAVAEAVDMLHRDGRAIKLVAVGSPMPDCEMSIGQVRQALHDLSGRPWIELRGPVDRESSTRLLNQADVVCLPSRYVSECQPLAVIEAMCAGRQLVVSNSPALSATVGDYPCETVESIDAASVAEALSRLSPSHPGLRALERGAAAARTRFSVERFDRVLAGILDGAGPGAAARAHSADNGPSVTQRTG